MNRRRFLRVTGSGFAFASAGLAGCLGSDDERPRREAEVFDDVALEGERMTIDLVSKPEVQSTKDNVDDAAAGMLVPTTLLPVGTVRAGSRSSGSSSGSSTSGATGRGSGGYSNAPTDGHTGWAVYGGHHRDDHDREDEATMYRASIATLGVVYVGSNAVYQQKSPGPNWGANEWDERVSDPEPGTSLEVNLATLTNGSGSAMSWISDSDASAGNETESGAADDASNATADNETDSSDDLEPATVDEGWYRVGVELESLGGDTSFGREAADFRLERDGDDLSIEEKWHVRPQL